MPTPAVIQALTALIPSLPASNKPFPPALVSQCESYLALSRQRASHLKLEEEIARAHACSEIACNRLRASLRLPVIKNGAGAPCKPRVYTKLLNYLEGILGDVTATASTPKGRKRDASGSVKTTPATGSGRKMTTTTSTPARDDDDNDNDNTPTKKRTKESAPTHGFAGVVKSNRKLGPNSAAGNANDDKAPAYMMRSIRKLCKHLRTPTLAPHVFTGTCVVLQLGELWPKDVEPESADTDKAQLLTVMSALYLMVLTRMQKGKMTTRVYTQVVERCTNVLELGEDAESEIERWIGQINEEGWCNGQEWWESTPESVMKFSLAARVAGDGDEVSSGDEDAEEEEDFAGMTGAQRRGGDQGVMTLSDLSADPEGVLLPGLGTMLNDAIDWTSEYKRYDYKEWEAVIRQRLGPASKSKAKKGRAVAVS